MSRAVDGVLAAMNLTRDAFGDQRDSAILWELSRYFNLYGSVAANLVAMQGSHAARELEGYVRKICCRC